jgi:hypothetical protein
MAVLMEMEGNFTPEQYDAIDKALDVRSDPPDGFIAHSAEDLGGGRMRVRDLWESADAFGAFAQSRLGPTIVQTLGDDAPEVPEPKFTELHNAYSKS